MLFGLAGLGVALAADDSKHARAIVGATSIGLHLAGQRFGRNQERVSDYHGMKYMHGAGYDTSAAVTLQEKFVALSEGRKSNWLQGLFASHPPSPERVANNRAALAEFPPGGELGKARYRAHMAALFEDQQAYDLADEARQNIDRNSARALRLIEEAIGRQPRESLFYGIRGDILASQGRHGDAVRSYDNAIERNPDYFGHYLGRGLSRDTLGDGRMARADLERSNSLLPTPFASYKLGGYALADGQRVEAKRLFEAASQASGDVGTAARTAFVSLDVEDAPWNYVKAKPVFEDGQVMVEVSNTSGYDLVDIVLRVHVEINGESVYRRVDLSDLASGYYDVLESGIHYGAEDDVNVGTRVLEAAPGW
ncbi:MAG: M48 family metalloprotease, partial [Gammaproteobacteria bacterium]|nr:M48 family metalloprotease [Gammaproteobacteria bacterium]